MDTGRIILQGVVRVERGDAEDMLVARILEREHVLYAEAAGWYAGVLGGGRGSRPPAGRKPGECLMRVAEPRSAAAYAAGCGRAVYVRPDGDAFAVTDGRPAGLPPVRGRHAGRRRGGGDGADRAPRGRTTSRGGAPGARRTSCSG